VVEYLLRTTLGRSIGLLWAGQELVAPELMDAEVLAVLRKGVHRGLLTESRAREALFDLAAWQVARVPHAPFLQAAFELRHNYSAYDALYVVVARRFGAALVTCDGPLSRAPTVPGVEIRNVV